MNVWTLLPLRHIKINFDAGVISSLVLLIVVCRDHKVEVLFIGLRLYLFGGVKKWKDRKIFSFFSCVFDWKSEK